MYVYARVCVCVCVCVCVHSSELLDVAVGPCPPAHSRKRRATAAKERLTKAIGELFAEIDSAPTDGFVTAAEKLVHFQSVHRREKRMHGGSRSDSPPPLLEFEPEFEVFSLLL